MSCEVWKEIQCYRAATRSKNFDLSNAAQQGLPRRTIPAINSTAVQIHLQMTNLRAFDIVGDVHGHAHKLHALLAQMGYLESCGAWRHPKRRVIFVGDYIDGGPHQLETVDTVRRMVEAETALAVMGNHEFNAIAWHTPDRDTPGDFLRTRAGLAGDKNRKQHAKFLAEVEGRAAEHASVIEWFKTLPLWLELPGLRVIHACWHPTMMERLRPLLTPGNRLTDELLVLASRKGTREYEAVETLLKGEEQTLPDGISFVDNYKHERHEVRTRWWHPNPTSLADIALIPPENAGPLRDLPLPSTFFRRADSIPTFFGHYWMSGIPTPLSRTTACVDYSVAKGGALVAYRWSGEQVLDAKNFVSVL